ncbi:MAG: monofunctional biosynthetic peptidoglycan transglycosylase [Sphingomonadales bacterium]|nr:monofunctional biosynthetic peptidoglycan transglycosylase [Sphingomonadales bacterium]PIX66799.1 MAG: monofunctional biosynthetic peptidoglycan transglycosylase [Sphingomonadales bacterium CG_4_10_14_3_um_filter_58_15]NCO48630.1 monofunctional biosynthetic peptidoglycan transglycosylase [Sphingomonadales bacterium]NCO98738.1 monofunctional biosynthetic peptidoglycan transglycosylase [Sphingomonadales bacterium]NCP28262.1 monofunctional biosynthetic peptidoglycan transglycosylase [Sphingomon
MRAIKFLFKFALYFILITVAWVGIYAIVPPPITATMIMDGNGITKDWTSFSDISPNMVRAVIAAEDGKFCSHNGFDTEAIQKAIERNAQGGRIRGGSTISQQVAKNAFLWQGGGFFRKGLEAYFTFLIETIWSKHRIMEVYLNIAETGIGTYGVQAGAQRYFHKDAKDLTRIEAARIAAALPLPKKRAVNGASGFTRRYGNTIAARINVVRNEKLDGCLYK